MLADIGFELRLCSRRGLCAWDVAARQRSPVLRDSLLSVLRGAGVGPVASEVPRWLAAGRRDATNTSVAAEIATSDCPLVQAIERGDMRAVRTMLEHGAVLEGEDIVAAIKSGDLDMLSFVQAESAKTSGTAEYRKMMHETATKIREKSRTNRRTSHSSASSAGDSLRHVAPSVPAGKSLLQL